MLDRREPHNRRDDAGDERDRGRWIVTELAMTGDAQKDSAATASLAERRDTASTAPAGAEDERALTRRISALLQARLHRSRVAGRPLPGYLNSLVNLLRAAPREPLVKAILALHRTRLRNGYVFVLTEETRAGLANRLVADLRRQGIGAYLVARHMPEPSACGDPARVEPLLRPGDVVIGLHGDSPAYTGVRAAASDAGATFVVFGAEQDFVERGVYFIACGSGQQVVDARLFFTYLICNVLAELVAPKRGVARAARLRRVS